MNFKVNIYICTSWKSPKQKKGIAGWVVEFIKSNGDIVTRPYDAPGLVEVEGTETKATLIALIEALKILTKSCEIRIFTLNERVFTPLKNGWIDTWKKNNFQSSKGKTVKNSEQWKEIVKLSEKHVIKIEKDLGSYKLILPSEIEKSVDFTLKGGE